MTNGDKATIREVYEIVNRIETKLDSRITELGRQVDKNTTDIANMKGELKGEARGQATGVSLVINAVSMAVQLLMSFKNRA